MSSYFDAAQAELTRLEYIKAARPAVALLAAVYERYWGYLEWGRPRLKEPSRIRPYRDRLTKVLGRIADTSGFDPPFFWMEATEIVQDLHSLAHEVGSARLDMRSGGRLGDNPYWLGHFDRPGQPG